MKNYLCPFPLSTHNINIGILALPAAFILNVFVLGGAPADVLAKWPTTVALNLLGIMFFYSFVMENGVMKYLVEACAYAVRNVPFLVPFVVFGASFVMAMTGFFPTMISPLLLPLFFGICDKLNVNKINVIIWQLCGSYSGSMLPSSIWVDLYRGFISQHAPEMPAEVLNATMSDIIVFQTVSGFIVFALYCIITKVWRCGKGIENAQEVFKKPEPLNDSQKKCMTVFAITMFLIIVPKMLAFFGVSWLAGFANKLDITLVFISAGTICALLRLGDAEKILKTKIPWDVAIMIFGMGALFTVLGQCGLPGLLASMIGSNLPPAIIVALFVIIGAVLTTVSDGMAVVIPLTFPVAWSIYSATGINPGMLYVSLILGLSVAGIFPLSSGGALVQSILTPEERKPFFKMQAIVACSNTLLYAIVLSMMTLFIL